MNYYKIPLVRRLRANLRAKNQPFKLYKYGESGGAWFQCFGLDLSLFFTSDGYCKAVPLRLAPTLYRWPANEVNLFHCHSLPVLGLKLQNFGLITELQAAQIFEVERQSWAAVRMAA